MTLYTDEVLADAPLYYFKFDETSGSSLSSSGTVGGFTLTKGSSLTLNAVGIDGRPAASLTNSSSSYGRQNFSGTINGAAMTYEFWIKTSDTRNQSKYIFTWGNSSASGSVDIIVGSDGTLRLLRNNSTIITSTVPITDAVGQETWKHILISSAPFDNRLYINGVLDSSNSSNVGQGGNLGYGYVGSTTSATIIATIDEFAIYNTALSDSRALAHYSAAVQTGVTVDVSSNSFTLTSKDVSVIFPVHTEVTTESPSVTVNSKEPLIETIKTESLVPSIDGTFNYLTNTIGDLSSPEVTIGNGPTYKYMVLGFTYPSGVIDMKSLRLKLNATGHNGLTPTLKISSITAPWNASSTSLTTGSYITVNADNLSSIDVSSIVDSGAFYGFLIERTDVSGGNYYITLSASESAVGVRPTLTARYSYAPTSQEVTLDSGSLSLVAPELSVSINSDVVLDAGSVITSSNDVEVDVTTDPNAVVEVALNVLEFGSHDVTVEERVEVSLDAVGAVLTAFEPSSVETTQGVLHEAENAVLNFKAFRPSEVQGEPVEETESEDRFFTLVRDTRTGAEDPGLWLRGNETKIVNGEVVVPDRSYYFTNPNAEVGYGARVRGVVGVGIPDGPSSRKVMHFDGNGYLEVEPGAGNDDQIGERTRTLMFGIRTTDENTFIMGSADEAASFQWPSSVVWGLQDGKISQWVDYRETNDRDGWQFKGFTNIADGNWHWVVIKGTNDGSPQNGNIEIWIDGKFELSRRSGVGPGTGTGGKGSWDYPTFGEPDWIGGYAGLDSELMFNGDISEVLFYQKSLAPDTANYFRDAFMDVFAVRPNAGKVSFSAKEVTIEDNAKRVLWVMMTDLYTSGNTAPERMIDQPFEPAMLREMGDGSLTRSYDVGPMKHFFIRGYNWVDERTEGFRLIDLENDIDPDFFDVINVIGWPYNSDRMTYLESVAEQEFPAGSGIGGRARVERFLEQFKNLIVEGKSTVITSPHLASDLGFIGGFEEVPVATGMFRDDDRLIPAAYRSPGDQTFTSDLRAGVINPFGTPRWQPSDAVASLPAGERKLISGHLFYDTHTNNQFVVRNLVPGLTDIPADLWTDWLYYVEPTTLGSDWEARKYVRRPNGMTVGDKFIFETSDLWDTTPEAWADGSHRSWSRSYRTWGISQVNAGTVVTTFSDTFWKGNALEQNPYRNHATVVAIAPGDELPDGREIAGKVFINVGDSPYNTTMYGYGMPSDAVPSNEWQIANLPESQRHLETDAQREWQYSQFRGVRTGYALAGTVKWEFRDGQWVANSTQGWNLSAYGRWWPLEFNHTIESMMSRGWKWIETDTDEDGNVLAGVSATSVKFVANEVEIEVELGIEVSVSTPVIVFNANKDEDTQDTEATVLAIAPSVRFVAEPYEEIVEVMPGGITFTAHEVEGAKINESEVISLTIFGSSMSEIPLNIRRNK